jgi:hypothetical protein
VQDTRRAPRAHNRAPASPTRPRQGKALLLAKQVAECADREAVARRVRPQRASCESSSGTPGDLHSSWKLTDEEWAA